MKNKTPQTIPELYEAMMRSFAALGGRMDRLESRMGRLDREEAQAAMLHLLTTKRRRP